MTASSGTSFFPAETKRSKPSGTFTRAKRSSPVSGSTASTPSESESPEMYGNGWPGPTASGVSTGKISRSKYASSLRISLSEQSSIVAISIPAAASAGRRSRRQRRAWRALRASTRSRIATSAWPAVIPSTERTPRPASSSSSRPATRTMKNSSRCWAKIAANLTRSRSGSAWSSAISRTRLLYSSDESSRLRRRLGVCSVVIATE